MGFRKVRGDFPALKEWTYLDNAFVGLTPRQVKEAWTPGPESTIVSYLQEGALELAARLKAQQIKVTERSVHGDHVRGSVHFYNTEGDTDRLLGEVL